MNIRKLGIRVVHACGALALVGCASASDGASEAATLACVAPPEDTEAAPVEAPGVTPQGFARQGLARQGWARQGLGRQGFWRNGLWRNAVWSNAIWSNGRWSNGVWRNGIWQNGVWHNAIWTNGIWANGVEQSFVVEGTELGVVTSEGTLVTGAEMVGAELELGSGERLTIASYAQDAADSELVWYTLTYQGQNICGEGTSGMFVPGLWDLETGARLPAEDVPEGVAPFSFSCSTGFLAKCVSWGYKPWASAEASDLHQTCARMAPADYCGNAVPHTENGTLIDVVDFEGIQQQASAPGEMTFEAGWGPDGAVCVNQTRYADSVVGQGPIEPSCWSALPRCANLEEAQAAGALVANFSQQAERSFCEAPARY